MAVAVGFEGANTVFRRPDSLSAAECADLQCFSNGGQIISCWRLTPEELAEIRKTGVVWLSILGSAMPPVMISGAALVTIEGKPAKAEPHFPAPPALK